MNYEKKAPRKPLFTAEQGKVFLSAFDDSVDEKIAKHLFVDGLTNNETANAVGYSTRQIERIRNKLLGIAIRKLIGKQIPKRVVPTHQPCKTRFACSICNSRLYSKQKFCDRCGQALDWSDTE